MFEYGPNSLNAVLKLDANFHLQTQQQSETGFWSSQRL